MTRYSRRRFLSFSAAMASTAVTGRSQTFPVIDIHQHTNYSGRADEVLVRHQQALGVRKSVLLPSAWRYGLAASAGGNETVLHLAKRYPERFVFFANEVPDAPEAPAVLEKYLRLGAVGIGEQKFRVECDSEGIKRIAAIARDYGVPVLMHFEHGNYNLGIARFRSILEKFPSVNFIGHAQTWWGNIDRNHNQETMYPKGTVTAGGITDRLLADYPNMFGDFSANSGLNSLLRDENHAREFLSRHQDKLMFGSDCPDGEPGGSRCIGANLLAALRRLAPSEAVLQKILHQNAKKVIRLT